MDTRGMKQPKLNYLTSNLCNNDQFSGLKFKHS